jgi:plasmid stabilization system protein ParE
MDRIFTLRYLPIVERDLAAARDYILHELHNPTAALRLIDDTYKAIMERLKNPLSFQPYPSVRKRKHLYYPIYIRNFIVFYVVIGNIMEVRRFLYSKRNLNKII